MQFSAPSQHVGWDHSYIQLEPITTCIRNNINEYGGGVFSELDFTGYTKKIGDSSKASDSHTVGKFGKGAMPAYSLSDTIQLLSGDDVMYLDPHARVLPNAQ
ncbi:hypothetical protein WJX82_002705 [Trebouxia sp. C0006]